MAVSLGALEHSKKGQMFCTQLLFTPKHFAVFNTFNFHKSIMKFCALIFSILFLLTFSSNNSYWQEFILLFCFLWNKLWKYIKIKTNHKVSKYNIAKKWWLKILYTWKTFYVAFQADKIFLLWAHEVTSVTKWERKLSCTLKFYD